MHKMRHLLQNVHEHDCANHQQMLAMKTTTLFQNIQNDLIKKFKSFVFMLLFFTQLGKTQVSLCSSVDYTYNSHHHFIFTTT